MAVSVCQAQELSGGRTAQALTNQDVIEMVGLGLSDNLITDKIRVAQLTDFDTTVVGLRALKAAKVSDAVIRVMVNAHIFFPDIATSPGPLTTRGKFKLFVNQSISPANVLVAASSAAINQARNVPRGYGQGWDAYGSRFGANMDRASSSSFFGTFLLASLLHEDPRFFPESKPSLWRSLKYSTQRIFITRNDSGKDVFNTSGLLGPLASEGLANVYLPSSEQTIGKTLTRFAADLAWRVGGNMFKDYWPTFFRDMGLNRLKVIPDPGTPRPGLKQAR
jgi:hypothetical protein